MATGIVLGLVAYLIPLTFERALVAGNYIVIAMDGGGYAALMHLRHRSILVNPGDRVVVGQHLGAVGNSGNTTQPHLHIQLMDRVRP